MKYRLSEDKLPLKFSVVFSSKIINEIEVIFNLNQNKSEELYQWYSYIDEIQNYISNRAIAWNYNGRNIKFPNGTFFIRDFDYNIGYTIKTNKTTNSSFVYVFMINLKPEEFGLKEPPINETLNNYGECTDEMYARKTHRLILEYINKHIPINESRCNAVRMNKRELNEMVHYIAKQLISEEYKVVEKKGKFKFHKNDTEVIDSLLTLRDEAGGETRVMENDGCYVLYQKVGDDYKVSTHIYPEAFNAMKKYLPNLPLH